MDPSTPVKLPNVAPPKCPDAPKKSPKAFPNIDIQANLIPTFSYENLANPPNTPTPK